MNQYGQFFNYSFGFTIDGIYFPAIWIFMFFWCYYLASSYILLFLNDRSTLIYEIPRSFHGSLLFHLYHTFNFPLKLLFPLLNSPSFIINNKSISRFAISYFNNLKPQVFELMLLSISKNFASFPSHSITYLLDRH